MTAISYHGTVNDLQGLDWVDGGPFARLPWFALLEESGMQPLLATAKSGEHAISLPLIANGQHLETLTNWYAFSWAGLRTNGLTDDTLLQTLARDLASRATRVNLDKLPVEDGTAARMAAAFRASGWVVLSETCDINHVLPVNGRDYAHYLAGRPGKMRTTLKRKAKKVEVDISTTFLAEDWAQYEAIYTESWKPEEGDAALLRKFAQQESAAGRFRFGIARNHGEAVAAQFWTVDQGTAYIHKLAHRESAKPLSAGTTLTAALFERVIDIDHVEMVDFGTGDDPYKRDWMEEVRLRQRLTCLRPRSPSNWPRLVKELAKAAMRKLVSPARDG